MVDIMIPLSLQMRFSILILCVLLVLCPLFGQTQLVSDNFYPAPMEFKELSSILEEKDLKDPEQLAALEHGALLLETGLRQYTRRSYTLAGAGTLSIEVLTVPDARGAYSLLTIFSDTPPQPGPPGDFYSAGSGSILSIAGNRFVRVRAAAGDLARRVALSVTNRIGSRRPNPPALIKHFPKDSCDPSTVRYFLASGALRSFGTPVAGTALAVPPDVEVAQARCASAGRNGTMTLLGFPTIVLAEEYFNTGAIFPRDPSGGSDVYTRQTGPMVAILEGNFEPDSADKTLGSITFQYSVKWIYDRASQSRTLWGVPVQLLGTVVRSLVFVALLCLGSIAAGIGLAAGRIYYRKRFGIAESSEFIRLKINED